MPESSAMVGGRARPRRALAFALFTVALGTNVSTPLLLIYQERLDLSAWTVTALFAIYPIGLLPALLWAGPASDVLGRRALMVPGVVASGFASGLFLAGAASLPVLFTGRFLLGAVSGVVFVVASAWIQEVGRDAPAGTADGVEDPLWPSRLTSIVLCAGFGGGPLYAGALGQWAPWPLHLSYVVHIVVVVAGLVALSAVPETVHVERRPFRPSLGVPQHLRSVFASVLAPTALCVFGFASLALGLFPVLLRPAMSSVAVFVTGVVAAVTTMAILVAQRMVARIGTARAAPAAFFCGAAGCLFGMVAFATDVWVLAFPAAVLLGVGSGFALVSGLRFVDMLTTPSGRGAMTGAFYAAAYAAMTMPVVVSSLARTRTAYVVVLCTVAGLATVAGLWVRSTVGRVAASALPAPVPGGAAVTESPAREPEPAADIPRAL